MKTFDQNQTKQIVAKKADFHTAILIAVLQAFSVPFSVFAQLETILKTIGDNLKYESEKKPESQQYWIMFTRYDWQPQVRKVQPGKSTHHSGHVTKYGAWVGRFASREFSTDETCAK